MDNRGIRELSPGAAETAPSRKIVSMEENEEAMVADLEEAGASISPHLRPAAVELDDDLDNARSAVRPDSSPDKEEADGDGSSQEKGDEEEGERDAAESGSVKESKLSAKRKNVQDEEVPVGLPGIRVKRIIKLDPDIKLVSKEAIFAIIHTTQLFLEALAAEALSQARQRKRKGVQAGDLVLASETDERFQYCFGSSLTQFLRSLHQEETSENEDNEGGEEEELQEEEGSDPSSKKRKTKPNKTLLPPPPNNRSMTDFFSRTVVTDRGESSCAAVEGE